MKNSQKTYSFPGGYTLCTELTNDGPVATLHNATMDSSIKISLSWRSHMCFMELPQSCHFCPMGFYTTDGIDCGRNIPWEAEDRDHRPDKCILELYDVNKMIEALELLNGGILKAKSVNPDIEIVINTVNKNV